MTATIYTLVNADFSNAGLPNVMPFVSRGDLLFAYDFSNRAEILNDLSGNGHDLTAIRNDIAAGIRSADNTIVKTIDNGSGINVEMGYLDTGIPTTPINLAVDEFTIMVVGGYSGVVFPAAKVAVSEAKSTTLIDLGTGIVNKALAIEHANQVMGARVVGYSPNITTAVGASQKCVLFVTYKSGSWTVVNKTTGVTTVKTNTQLGISGTLAVDKNQVNNIVIGHYHKTSTYAALYPSLYQIAKWTRALTPSEIDSQYSATLNAHSDSAL